MTEKITAHCAASRGLPKARMHMMLCSDSVYRLGAAGVAVWLLESLCGYLHGKPIVTPVEAFSRK